VSIIGSSQAYEYWPNITFTKNADAVAAGQDFDLVSPTLMNALEGTVIPSSKYFDTDSSFDAFFQLIYLRYPNMDKETLLYADNLTSIVNEVWQSFTAIWFSNTQRIPISDSDNSKITALISGIERRMTVSVRSTLIMQGLLGVLILCVGICAYLNRGADRILYQPPYTIASIICLVQGSKLPRVIQQTYEDLPEEEMITERRLKKVLENYRVRLGWFEQENGTERYGVEIFPKNDEGL
jgi:hypothetical protein